MGDLDINDSNILDKLSYLNLDGEIECDQSMVQAIGGHCDVLTGYSRKGNKKVAVKKLRVFLSKDEKFVKRLLREVYIWSKLKHKNVLPLSGFFLEGGEIPHLVSEWMERGTLHDILPSLKSDQDVISMCLGISAGLSYLHDMRVVHADLKSYNILISQTGEPLLADFGVSHVFAASVSIMCGTSTTNGNLKGTVRWMAIELLSPSKEEDIVASPTAMSDVWAFGMTVYEILAQNAPYNQFKGDIQVGMAICRGELPCRPSGGVFTELKNTLWDICISCWRKECKERPSMTRIVSQIAAIKSEILASSASTLNSVVAAHPRPLVVQDIELTLMPEVETPAYNVNVSTLRPRPSVIQDIERTLTSEARTIGTHFQRIEQLSLAVSMLLEQELGRGANSYRQWGLIATMIQRVVASVRQVSFDGQTLVEDVLISFHDYSCFSAEDECANADEIQGYKTDLRNAAVRTKEVISHVFVLLEDAQAKIVAFNGHWPIGDTQYSRNIKPRIQEVQSNIRAILISIEDLRAGKNRKNRASNVGVQHMPRYSSRIKIVRSLSLMLPQRERSQLREYLKGTSSPGVEEAQNDVDDQIDQTFDSLVTLINVCEMLSSDISELRRQFNEHYRSRDLYTFKTRFNYIRSLYACLPYVLREFNTACYTPVKNSLSKREKKKPPTVLRLAGIK